MTGRIDTGDTVLHAPTGEEWLVAYVRDDKLAACGWPDTIANLSDCTLVSKATPEERQSLLESMAGSNGHRASYAQRALGVAVPAMPTCKCGQPWVLNTVHRANTPCYRAADPVDGLGGPSNG
jgi:hypothetical protein